MYDKDTVGEDMELVVRLSRQAREKKTRYAVQYCYNANCWTEVPEQLGIFRKQRDRWQRGLIDILSFHGKIMANPRYGTMGLLGFPYYLIYEMLGPWIETSGLLALIACAALSWLSLPLLAFVILSSVVLGIFVSLFALLISQWDKKIFPVFDQIKLMIVSVVEAFGFRQWVGAYRVIGYINTLRKKTGWGKMTRRGFAKTGGPK
jgi:cellulose synthase/poly-beta-1,6-N-acetylglucosamine synthase-like glycosyltransferase